VLGGNSLTTLIATIGPIRSDASETLSTLLFATRCMDVSTRATINVQVDYRELCGRLEAEMRQMHAALELARAAPPPPLPSVLVGDSNIASIVVKQCYGAWPACDARA
jgi:hypothetical protein